MEVGSVVKKMVVNVMPIIVVNVMPIVVVLMRASLVSSQIMY